MRIAHRLLSYRPHQTPSPCVSPAHHGSPHVVAPAARSPWRAPPGVALALIALLGTQSACSSVAGDANGGEPIASEVVKTPAPDTGPHLRKRFLLSTILILASGAIVAYQVNYILQMWRALKKLNAGYAGPFPVPNAVVAANAAAVATLDLAKDEKYLNERVEFWRKLSFEYAVKALKATTQGGKQGWIARDKSARLEIFRYQEALAIVKAKIAAKVKEGLVEVVSLPKGGNG